MMYPNKEMDVALLKSMAELHETIIPVLSKIKDAKCKLIKLDYLKPELSKGNLKLYFINTDNILKFNHFFADAKDLHLVMLLCPLLMNKQIIKAQNMKYRATIAETQSSIVLIVKV